MKPDSKWRSSSCCELNKQKLPRSLNNVFSLDLHSSYSVSLFFLFIFSSFIVLSIQVPVVADHFHFIGTRLHFLATFATEGQSPNTPSHVELQDILGYRFSNPLLLDEATLTRGGGSAVTPQSTHGNKPLALVGDALIRLDVGVRSYVEGTGTGKQIPSSLSNSTRTCTK